MSLAIYAEGELNCDGPGKPYKECVAMPPAEEIPDTAATLPRLRAQMLRLAKNAGWKHGRGNKWMCPDCQRISKW